MKVPRSSPLCSLLLAGVVGCHRPPEALPGGAQPAPPAATPRGHGAMPAGCLQESAVVVLDHRVELSLGPTAIEGRGEILVRSWKETGVILLDARGLRVGEVRVGEGRGGGERESKGAPFWSEGGRLCVGLPGSLPAGSERLVEVAWGVPVDRPTPRVSAGEVWAGYEAAAWMPTLQDPTQRATLSLRLVVPAGWRATGSGRGVGAERASDGRGIFSFSLAEPSPPFLYAFAAGSFAEASRRVGGVTLRALGPPGADLELALAVTAPMLTFFEERLGRSFPGDEYREVFVQGDAAQEAAGFSLLAASALGDLRADPTEDWIFSHELAHQWFAWLVPCVDFSEFWLNEGFASFLVAAAKEHRWGRAAYDREVALWRRRSARAHAEGRDAPLSLSPPGQPLRHLREADLPPRGVTYARGALALHRLRAELGDELFWRGLRRYVDDRAGKGARSEDLRASFEAATGRDLTAFFSAWIYAAAPGI